MSESSIEWTEHTWNPVRGCTKISPGCKNCYASTFAERWRDVAGHPYEQGFDLRLVPEKLDEPLRRKKPTTWFVNSMSDLFHDDVPDDFIADVFAVMVLCPQHTFQVLTKRARRMRILLAANDDFRARVEHRARQIARDRGITIGTGKYLLWPISNVWCGVSVEDQQRADERIPLLLETPAAIRFLSCEPLLGPVNLELALGLLRLYSRASAGEFTYQRAHPLADGDRAKRVDWVIVGGESGPGARPCDVAWIRSIVEQCRAAGTACFVKQLGAMSIEDLPHRGHAWLALRGAQRLHADRKGGDPTEWPEDLRVREMPMVRR